MSVLVLYDGWQTLATFGGVAVVIIAPTLALAVAHFFAEAVDEHASRGRPLHAQEWRQLIVDQLQVFLIAVPPLIVLGIGWISPLSPLGTIEVLLWTGCLTLVALAVAAAHQAGIRGWRLFAAGVLGGVVGLIVISLQIVLKPH